MTQPVSAVARVACADEPIPSSETCSESACAPHAGDGAPPECPVGSVGILERADLVLQERALRFCREADTVVEGFLCDEPLVVSNACRHPGNDFDAYVCDEPRMHALQRRVLDETFALLKQLLLAMFKR